MQEICTSLMVVCALFSYCVICYIDTSMLICINHTTFNNDDLFSIGSGPRLDLEKMLPRSGYTAQYTAQGNFRHYLFNLQEDVRSSIPPSDKHKAFYQTKWNETIGFAFDAFTKKDTMNMSSTDILDHIELKVVQLQNAEYGQANDPEKGQWCLDISIELLQSMIYRPAYASCLKHHDSLAMNSADADSKGIEFLCRLRDFSNPAGAGALHRAKEDLRNLKFKDTDSEDTRTNFISHIEKFLSIIETIKRLGDSIDEHQQLFYFNESLPETSSFLSLSRRLEEHSADKTSTWEKEKTYALQYIQTKSFKSAVKEQAHFAMLAPGGSPRNCHVCEEESGLGKYATQMRLVPAGSL